MAEVELTVDNGVSASFNKLADTLDTTIVEYGIAPFLKTVQKTAQQQHRYTRRSGKLERSVRVETTTKGGSVYLDDGVANYGKYVHEGFRSWGSDKFLENATDNNLRALDADVDRAIDKAINDAGL